MAHTTTFRFINQVDHSEKINKNMNQWLRKLNWMRVDEMWTKLEDEGSIRPVKFKLINQCG